MVIFPIKNGGAIAPPLVYKLCPELEDPLKEVHTILSELVSGHSLILYYLFNPLIRITQPTLRP